MTIYVDGELRARATSVTGRGVAGRLRADRPHPMTTRHDVESSKVDHVLDDSFPASDPPSWTGAISHVAISAEHRHMELLARRVRAEFLEMPGLCLTLEQAQRLWNVDRRTCEALLTSLTDARFLRRTDRGLFVVRASRV
jgi:hypothetical protein